MEEVRDLRKITKLKIINKKITNPESLENIENIENQEEITKRTMIKSLLTKTIKKKVQSTIKDSMINLERRDKKNPKNKRRKSNPKS